MMQGLMNVMRGQVGIANSALTEPAKGIITGYDPDSMCVKVELQPDGAPTGWLQLGTPWVGNGWGMFAAPSIGDQVSVHFEGGDTNSGFVELRYFNDDDRALPVPSGEFWLVHQSGSSLKLLNNGKLLLNGNVEIDATAPKVVITTTGDTVVNASGSVSVTAAVSAIIAAPSIMLQSIGGLASAVKALCNEVFMDLFKVHTHKTNSVGSQTDPPLQQPVAGTHTTSIVKAE